MIKWGDSVENDILLEAFLPEHEREGHHWLLRASSRGHVLEERTVPLTYPPRFGPDAGDVAVLEAASDVLMQNLTTRAKPQDSGSYVPGPCFLEPPNPWLLAALHTLLQHYLEKEKALQLTPEQSSQLFELPPGLTADGLYPLAITGRRDRRMHQVIGLANLIENNPQVHARKAELIGAMMADDIPSLRRILVEERVELGDSGSAPTEPPNIAS